MKTDEKTLRRIHTMSFASVYPSTSPRRRRSGRTKAELHQVITWLTGFDDAHIARHVEQETTFEEFFADAHLNENAPLIKGVICGVRWRTSTTR